MAQALSFLDEAPGTRGRLAGRRPGQPRPADARPSGARGVARAASPHGHPQGRALAGDPAPPPSSASSTLSRSLGEVVVVDCGFSLEDDEELSYDTMAPRRNARDAHHPRPGRRGRRRRRVRPGGAAAPGPRAAGARHRPDAAAHGRREPGPPRSRRRQPGATGVRGAVRASPGSPRCSSSRTTPPRSTRRCSQGRALVECAPGIAGAPAVRSLAEKVAGAPAGRGRRRRRGLRVSR